MGYHDYLSCFSNKKEVKKDIKESLTNSKEFVNIFLGYTNNKSVEDTDKLFNNIIDKMANIIVESK